jgi:hypothetical protein
MVAVAWMPKRLSTYLAIASAIAAAAVVVPIAPAGAAGRVLPPPPSTFVPARGGTSAAAPCGGSVLCVGPSGGYSTISAAVAAAKSGNTIQVEGGTYPERVSVSGKQLNLRGGFVAGFARRNPTARPTVIDGQGGGTTVQLVNAGNSAIDGFTITGGRAPLDAYNGASGSGINVVDSGDVTIRNNLVQGNDDRQNFNTCSCETVGGGIAVDSYLKGSSVDVTGNIIRNNRAHRGAGMAIGVKAVIARNLVANNQGGGDHGGGLYLNAPTMLIRQNLIRDNKIGVQAGYGWGGGAIFYGPGNPTPKARFEANRFVGNSASVGSGLFIDDDASATITGDLFHDNACDAGGAALYVDGTGVVPTGSTATLENVTMTDHTCTADTRGSAIFTEGGSSIAVTNSIITRNGGSSQIFVCTDCASPPLPQPPKSTIEWSLLAGAAVNVTKGGGMLAGDPGFVNRAATNFHLARSSKAIDAADPASPVGEEPRPNGGRRNIGAYGGSVEATTSRGGAHRSRG